MLIRSFRSSCFLYLLLTVRKFLSAKVCFVLRVTGTYYISDVSFIFHHRQNGVVIVVVLLDKQTAAFFVEPFAQLVGNR